MFIPTFILSMLFGFFMGLAAASFGEYDDDPSYGNGGVIPPSKEELKVNKIKSRIRR